jgi:hypothetical protein
MFANYFGFNYNPAFIIFPRYYLVSYSKKSIVVLAIENTLLKTGGSALLDEVNSRLYKKFNSSISDCFEHPVYLKEILKEIFGQAHDEITKSIVDEMKPFDYDDAVMQFVEKINCC